MVVRIEPVDVHTTSQKVLRGMHQAYVDREEDFYPNDPPPSFEYLSANWLAPGGIHRVENHWVAIEADEIVGTARSVTWADHEDSGLVVLAVRREHRQQGVGGALLGECLNGLEAQGRTKLIIDAPEDSPASAGLERLGLKKALGERVSRLDVAEVDWGLMDGWIATAQDRAADYNILFLESPIPEEHIEKWCRISDVMNSAPLEDLDLEDATMTPEKWRSMEAYGATRGLVFRGAVAVHRPTGEFAGLSVLFYQQLMSWLGLQDDTGVDPTHRNKGLGRLLKAAMIKRFVAEFPDVEKVETGNAGSNEPMLNINVEMGFKPVLIVDAWQGEISKAREALGG